MTVAVKVSAAPVAAGFDDDVTVVEEEAADESTTWTIDCVPPAKLGSPEYNTLMEWEPALNPFVLSAAEPDAKVTVPSRVEPSRNSIVPVGFPAPATTATEAENVTAWLNPDGLADDITATLVVAGLIVSVPAANAIA
jgi:hypothetical protein